MELTAEGAENAEIYLKLSEKKLGTLINFHVLRLKDGFKRIVNGL